MADFGISRQLKQSVCYTKHLNGMIPYVDPINFDSSDHSYSLTKNSDIYSLGVLFWELTSCSSPFNFKTGDTSILLKIIKGGRERPIQTTNGNFVKLYQSNYNYNF